MPIQVSDAFRDGSFARRQTGLLFNLPVPDADLVQPPEGISLCMIVKNEERFLAECLESVKDVVDEINIVDTGSTDRTVEIARSYGANVEFREWRNDFSWARNESLAMATRRWVLVLDADEELERESRPILRSLRGVAAGTTCVYVDIVNLIDDATGGATMSHRLLRVFPNTPRLRYRNLIHESLALDGGGPGMAGVISPLRILHKGYTVEIMRDRKKDARNRPLVEKAYEEDSQDLFAMFNYGNAAICAGNHEEGIACLERMLDLSPDPKIYFPLAYVMIGQTYAENLHEPDKALAAIERGLESFPLDASLKFTKGQIIVHLGEIEEARKLYHEALSLREVMLQTAMTDDEIFEWKIYFAMAGTYEREGNFDEAVSWIDRAIANKPDAFSLHRTRAKLLEKTGRHYDADVTYRRMAEFDPSTGRIEWINYLLRRGRNREAMQAIEGALATQLNPITIANLNVMAARAAQTTLSDDPIPYLKAALQSHPASGSALALYEQILSDRGDVAGLERFHAEELQGQPVAAEDYCRRSYRMLALERFEEARDTALDGLLLDEANAELRFNVGMARLRLGETAQAEEEFGLISPGNGEIYPSAMEWRARLQLSAGKFTDAAVSLERWLASIPRDASCVLKSAELLVRGGAREEARALLKDHVGDGPSVAAQLASMYLQDGDFVTAGQIADSALK